MANVSESYDPALDWAIERFGFDLADRGAWQDGVASLQKWLNESGADLAVDGILGPNTISVLQKIHEREQQKEPNINFAPEAPDDLNVEFSQNVEQNVSEAVEKKATKKTKDPTPNQYPDTDIPNEPNPDTKGTTIAATASPVALSDSAIDEVSQDRLGFRPYVEAVAEFILAEQTRPPLSIAVNARWGQGKTSFMNMLDKELKHKAKSTTTRVATTWFNPWKYSEPAQVWAAFIANVTRCLSENLTPGQSRRFRWERYRKKWQRHADLALVVRVVVAVAFFVIIGSLAAMDWKNIQTVISQDYKLLGAFYDSLSRISGGYFFYIPIGFGLLLSVIYLYITFTKKIGLNLLEYVEKTDFKDKIGTLSQFESEMRRLANAVPDDLKVIVFIDDLDRCKGQVLGEIIEALQLADVSRTCVFVMGMDLQIVSSAIESQRSELTNSTGGNSLMEHGSGYKFLEKIIQARLSLPSNGRSEMETLVKAAMGSEEPGKDASQERPGEEADKGGVIRSTMEMIGLRGRPEKEAPKDSPQLIEIASYYGSKHFSNPRRLKRFINGFRLQAYLANAVQPESIDIERLARFLVLAEQWPALLNCLVQENVGADGLFGDDLEGELLSMSREVEHLRESDRKRLNELLYGRSGNNPLTAEQIQTFAAWCGFFYYRGHKK